MASVIAFAILSESGFVGYQSPTRVAFLPLGPGLRHTPHENEPEHDGATERCMMGILGQYLVGYSVLPVGQVLRLLCWPFWRLSKNRGSA